jgi:general stress protein CsbA
MAQLDATNAGGFSMRNIAGGARTAITPKLSARLGFGSWVVLIVLVVLLFAACVVGYIGWKLADGVDVPISGYVAMVVGVIASLAVGFGLMALVFYSSRKGYDEPPVLIVPENDFKEFDSPSKRAS